MKLATSDWQKRGASRFAILFCCWLLPAVLAGQGRDSVTTAIVDPGVTHVSIVKEGPYLINVLVVDLKAHGLSVESYRPTGLVTTSEQVRRNDSAGHRVVGAINADFFSYTTGWPVNNQVVHGEFVLGTPTSRSHLMLDRDGKAYIERLSFEGSVWSAAGFSYPVAGVNVAHRDSEIVVHTTFSDTATRAAGSGTLLLLRRLGEDGMPGDTLRYVHDRTRTADLGSIPTGHIILCLGRSIVAARGEFEQADTLSMVLGTRPAFRWLSTIVGGVGRILWNGEPVADSINVQERTNVTFLQARHPRSFVGFNRDTTKLYLCTVDGRQESSIGMNFHEMAAFLLSIGVWNAMNLDGGGSTTMVVNGKIVNSPSDLGGERKVANTLQVVRRNNGVKRD